MKLRISPLNLEIEGESFIRPAGLSSRTITISLLSPSRSCKRMIMTVISGGHGTQPTGSTSLCFYLMDFSTSVELQYGIRLASQWGFR